MGPHLSPGLTPQHKNITESQIEIVAILYLFTFFRILNRGQDIDMFLTTTYILTILVTSSFPPPHTVNHVREGRSEGGDVEVEKRFHILGWQIVYVRPHDYCS